MDVVRRLLGVVGIVAVVAVAIVPATVASADPDPRGKLLMVLDSSGSMKEPDSSGATKIDAAKQALNDVVDRMPGDAQVGLRVYGATVFDKSRKGACTDSQLVVPVGTANKPALHKAISTYKPYGETPIAYSLQQAAKDIGTDGKRSILLVSDGEETCNPNPCAVAKAIHDKGIDLRIDVVGLHVDAAAQQQLRCVADAGGGKYYDAADADDLTATLEQSALRKFRPFTLSGLPVEGATTKGDARLDVLPGQYTDNLGGTAEDTGRRYYEVARASGSSIHVGFTAYPTAHSGTLGYNDAVTLTLESADGTECVSSTGLQMRAGTRNILVGSISFTPQTAGSGAPCADEKRLLLEIKRGPGPAPETGSIPFEFVLVDEPALADDGGLPEPVATGTAPTQDATVEAGRARGPVAGGGEFSQATTLEPGMSTDSVQGGEVLFYRVRTDWGQTPKVSFRLQPSRPAALVLGAYGVNAQVAAFSPTRAQLQQGDLKTVTGSATTTLSSGLLPVRYLNREGALSDSSPRRMMSLAGYYYFVLTMASSDNGKFQLPVQISVEVDGTPSGRPHYQAPPAKGPGSTPKPKAVAPADKGAGLDQDGSASAAEEKKGKSLLPVALVGGGVVLVVAIGVVLLAILRGRARARGRGRQNQGHMPAGYR